MFHVNPIEKHKEELNVTYIQMPDTGCSCRRHIQMQMNRAVVTCHQVCGSIE